MLMSFHPARNIIATRVYFHILSAYSDVLSRSPTREKKKTSKSTSTIEIKPFSNLPLEPSSFRYMQNIVCGPSFFMLRQFSAHHQSFFRVAPFFVSTIFLPPCQLPRAFLQYIMVLRCSCPRVQSCLATKLGFNFWQLYDATTGFRQPLPLLSLEFYVPPTPRMQQKKAQKQQPDAPTDTNFRKTV